MATLKELRDVRLEKLHKLIALGINPYPPKAQKEHEIGDIITNFKKMTGKTVSVAGRIMAYREHGGLVFADVKDGSGKIQLYIKESGLANTDKQKQLIGFEHLNLLDVGDFVQVIGKVTETKTGEKSIEVTELRLVSKSLRPLPDKHFGLQDTEEKYRKRYLDILTNDESRKILDMRWKIEQEIRKFLWSEKFVEVETPVLQSLYGGTNAKPFTTHFNALDVDFYLRIAPELYLKRLSVAGYEKIFEIARNFRNEGIDQTHFPEFTMLEWYEAYADYHRVMDLAEALTKHLVKELTGGSKITVGETEIDIGGTWSRVPVEELVKKQFAIDWETVSDAEVKKLLVEHKLEVHGMWEKGKALFSLYDHVVTKELINPIWVLDYPVSVSPLAKTHRTKQGRAERFEGYIGGVEVFDGWSEIVSGLEQRDRFENEQKNMKAGDDEAMPLDEDFIEALEYGCPPLGGIGFGIDRLVMFLSNTWSIKKVVAFPILRPKTDTDTPITEKKAEKSTAVSEQNTSHDLSGLPTRENAKQLLEKHVSDDYQKIHAQMVARVLEAYADKLGENKELWYLTGLLHDLDYFEYPDDHPSVELEWFAEWGYPTELIQAVKAHARSLTGVEPQTTLDAAILATDELCGLLYAYSLMRPEGFAGMEASSAKKKFKDKAFARKIDREEVLAGVDKFGVELGAHIAFIIAVMNTLEE